MVFGARAAVETVFVSSCQRGGEYDRVVRAAVTGSIRGDVWKRHCAALSVVDQNGSISRFASVWHSRPPTARWGSASSSLSVRVAP